MVIVNSSKKIVLLFIKSSIRVYQVLLYEDNPQGSIKFKDHIFEYFLLDSQDLWCWVPLNPSVSLNILPQDLLQCLFSLNELN